MDFSLIVPCYNEADNIPLFFEAATSCFDNTDIISTYEIIFVDDGSSDETERVLGNLITSYRSQPNARACVRIVEFSRNFGKEAAMLAGLGSARGNYLGFIDADMQQDPRVAHDMLSHLIAHPETDCVAAKPEKRRENLPMRVCKKLFYHTFDGISGTNAVADASDFRVFTRQVARALLATHEHYRFTKGLFAWIGFRTYVVTYEVQDRHAGTSKWSFRKLFSYAANGMLSFATWPLRIVLYIGTILLVMTAILFGIDFVELIALNDPISTDRVFLYVLLFTGSVQMLALGLIGEYLARAYIETKRRPLYIERSTTYSAPPGALDAPGATDTQGEANAQGV